MDLSVLSAESYYDRPIADEARDTVIEKNTPITYYGGIVLSDDTDLHGSQDNPTKIGRGSGDEGDSKRRRGRPRINTRDDATSDRRRTQIRLAQRAYRSRKESTILSLKDRATRLEKALKEMNNLFLTFNDSVIESGILRVKPQLASILEQTTKRFTTLTRTSVCEPRHENHPIDDPLGHEYPSPSSDILTTRNFFSGNRSSGDSSSRTSSRPASVRQPQAMASEIICGREDWPELLPDVPSDRSMSANFTSEDALEICTQTLSRDQPMQYLGVDGSRMTRVMTSPSPMLDQDLQTPFTYSHHESTFARRLHRASLEREYGILTSPHSSEEEVTRTFGLCFHFKDIASIANMLRRLLKRSSTESLDNWAAPFHHLGGAGTHYPRFNVDGSKIPLPNMQAIGPSLQHPPPETSRPKDVTTEQLLRLIGWDGVWLDPYDVEQYLSTEKGLRLDGHSMFAEMTVPLNTDPTATFLDTASSTESSMHNVEMMQSVVDRPSPLEYTSSHHGWTSTGGTPDLFEDQVEVHNFTPDLSGTCVSHATLKIDLNKLLSAITQRSAHIGRCPGFRKADVDSALRAVIQKAF